MHLIEAFEVMEDPAAGIGLGGWGCFSDATTG